MTELPVRTWTQSYKELLESMMAPPENKPALIKEYRECGLPLVPNGAGVPLA